MISDSTVYGLTYHYDELNRLIFVDRPMGRDDSISYQTDKITNYNIPVQMNGMWCFI